jgi:hypothetical protein
MTLLGAETITVLSGIVFGLTEDPELAVFSGFIIVTQLSNILKNDVIEVVDIFSMSKI